MNSQQEQRWNISPSAREKCIEQARKAIRIQERWGSWSGLVCFVLGFASFALGIVLIVLIQKIALMDRNVGGVWGGVVLGMLLGIILISIFYQSGSAIVKGIKFLRGDPADRILVEYHDALLALMRTDSLSLPSEPDASVPESALSSSETNA